MYLTCWIIHSFCFCYYYCICTEWVISFHKCHLWCDTLNIYYNDCIKKCYLSDTTLFSNTLLYTYWYFHIVLGWKNMSFFESEYASKRAEELVSCLNYRMRFLGTRRVCRQEAQCFCLFHQKMTSDTVVLCVCFDKHGLTSLAVKWRTTELLFFPPLLAPQISDWGELLSIVIEVHSLDILWSYNITVLPLVYYLLFICNVICVWVQWNLSVIV